jgi:hypothetical protein
MVSSDVEDQVIGQVKRRSETKLESCLASQHEVERRLGTCRDKDGDYLANMAAR